MTRTARRFLVAGLAATAVVSGVAAPAFAAEAPMSVRGSAGGQLGPEFGPMAGDPVRFEIQASATDPMKPSGTFKVTHHKPDGSLLARFSGEVTGLHAVGQVGVVNGKITWAEHPGAPQLEFVGKPVSLTVQDEGRHGDRIGWVWGFFGQPVSPLQGTAPVLRLSDGDLSVRGPVPGADAAGRSAAGGADKTAVAAGDGAEKSAAGGSGLAVAAERDRGHLLAGTVRGTSKDPEFLGDPLMFSVAARVEPGATPDTASGRFHVTHHKPDGGLVADFSGRITCLAVGGRVGMATGVVEASADPAHVGLKVSFSVYDRARGDRIGWLWGVPGSAPVLDCQGFTPFFAPSTGGFLARGL
ncbi:MULTISPECIES: hypothetical protein [unclassified Crossiella]|uniref:hypothetical protein n=1 Tax=unclassified Crossiella TaxID=2620835 RepID=UPI0020004C41|nr:MULTISPECIES: hypothetical protein [unclassified Crossiella]MCK2242549.1 hypothetical protein [Crossiella sp. S99.2]MCK2254421.1 hypothetical protein [Crossiella sp. S99.1]